MKPSAVLVLVPALLLTSCIPRPPGYPVLPAGHPEAVSLMGTPLYSPELPLATRQRLETDLAVAHEAFARAPADADAAIWFGRRMAYLGRYRDAIGIFSDGIRRNPHDPRLYRHRGHRFITVREFDRAIRDLRRAAQLMEGMEEQVEPDGMPNPAGVPRTTLQFNVWYHLGLAYYLAGDLERALPAFRNSLAASRNDDALVAATDWTYMTLRRLGRHEEAELLLEPIHPEMEILENAAYLQRLLMYRGDLAPESLLEPGRDALTAATMGYGVGNWFLYTGRRREAEEVFWRVTAAENWAPFGYIAAEADLRRLGRTRRPTGL